MMQRIEKDEVKTHIFSAEYGQLKPRNPDPTIWMERLLHKMNSDPQPPESGPVARPQDQLGGRRCV
jgi:hypothetical protein